MRLLIDSHVFIWSGTGDRRLSKAAAVALANPDNDVFVSVVTHWEILIKQRRDSDFVLPAPFASLVDRAGYQPLALDFEVPTQLETLPDLHGDPFDRLLIAQALHHELTLITGDRTMRSYPVETLW